MDSEALENKFREMERDIEKSLKVNVKIYDEILCIYKKMAAIESFLIKKFGERIG